MAIDTQQVDLRRSWAVTDLDDWEVLTYVYDCDDIEQAELAAYDALGPGEYRMSRRNHFTRPGTVGEIPYQQLPKKTGLPHRYGACRGESTRYDLRPQGPEFG